MKHVEKNNISQNQKAENSGMGNPNNKDVVEEISKQPVSEALDRSDAEQLTLDETNNETLGRQGSSSDSKGARFKKTAAFRCVFTTLGIALCVILIPLVICNLILIIKGYVNKDEVPSLFSISPMYVMTDSMTPTINGGDLIFVKKVASADIVVEDVIAFFDPESMENAMIVHRVKEISTDEAGNLIFRTMGDANNVYDTFIISSENVVGRYVFRLRGMGRAAMFMQSTYGLIISVSIPLIILIGYETIRQLIYYKKEQTDNIDT